MRWFDRQPPEIRALINEHGNTLIKAMMDCGVTEPKHIAHIIKTFTDCGLYGNGRVGRRDP